MKPIFSPLLLAICLAAAQAPIQAQAATGLATLPATDSNGPVTVFYPAAGTDQAVQRGPFTLQALPEAAPLPGNGRLIVVSHGSGSAPWTYTELAGRLVAAGYIVAFPEHAGDNWQDMSKIGPASFRLRPLEVSAAIDAVQADPRFAALADFSQVGLWGMSAGGHTALTLAGGRWSAAQLRDHCENHLAEATNACTTGAIELKGGLLDGLKKTVALAVIRHKLSDETWHSHTDPRIKAIISGVPFAADFDMASLAKPVVPLGIVQARQDVWLLPRLNSGAVLQACKTCELVADLPTAGHGSLLAPLPAQMDTWLASMLEDPAGFDRARDLPAVYDSTAAFFSRHLLP
jgi:predicted dienelactone hydrolase